MALYLTEEDVSGLLDMDTAIEAVEEAFRHQGNGLATNSPRGRLRLTGGHFNLMTAAAPGLGVMGLKAYAGGGFRVHLSSSETGELLAIIEAGQLGRLRTGAASGVAARLLSREDSATLGTDRHGPPGAAAGRGCGACAPHKPRGGVQAATPNEGEPSRPTPRARWASKSRPPAAQRSAWTRPTCWP